MAYSVNVGLDFTWPASADLSANQYKFVTLNSSKQLALAGADVECLGVLQDKPKTANQDGQVRYFGISKVACGGTFAAGDKIASDSNGKAVKATVASVSAGTPEPLAGSHVIGLALEAGVSGQTSTILLLHSGLTN